MPLSQNAWSANDRSVIASYQLPGGKVALRKGDVSVILLWCANRFHETVEPLRWPGIWGYAERTIRGSSTSLSNHASGTAVDLNAPAHPLGRAGTFSADQVRAIRQILVFCEGAVRWGGDYSGRKDEMHLELVTTAAGARHVADKIRGAIPASAPAPAPVLPTSRGERPMLIKTQPDKTKPVVLTALLSGPMFIGLGPTETPSDEQAKQMGLPVLWVEYGTWRDIDARSHALCDTPRPVAVQNWPASTSSAPRADVVTNAPSSPNQ
jgi:hypothetical protein